MMEVGKFTSLGSLFDQSSRFIFYLCMIISMYKGDGNLQLVGDKLRIFFFYEVLLSISFTIIFNSFS